MLVPFDQQKEGELRMYGLSAGARAWYKGELVIDSDMAAEPLQADQEQSVAAGPPPEPDLEVCHILPSGKLDPKMHLFQGFLENDLTQAEAEALLQKFVRKWSVDDAPCLPPRAGANSCGGAADVDAAVAALQGERSQVVTRSLPEPGSLADVERQHSPWKVDFVLQNAKLRVMISKLGRGFVVAVAPHKVLKDSVFLSPGQGGFPKSDDTAVEEGAFSWKAELKSDEDEVMECQQF